MNRNDCRGHSSYNPDMARKRENVTVVGPDWFLVDWMRSLHVTQAKLGRETGWSKATVQDICHGKPSYYRTNGDRKRVVKGQMASGRVDLGGRCILKTKKKQNNQQ